MEEFLKIIGIIALVIIAICLLPFFFAVVMWLIKILAGFTIGGFLVVLLVVLIIYIIWS